MELLAQNLLNGLTIGAFYALVALGYTMVYGVLKLINFAHGGLFMWGAYLGWTSSRPVVPDRPRGTASHWCRL
jgi:branched-chain amino acid transport system permease protein